MRLTDETLMAYADGELSLFDAKRVERAMAEDPELARRVRRFSATRRALKSAYDKVVSQPVPDHLLKLLDAIPDAPLASPPREPDAPRASRALPKFDSRTWAMIVGSLIVGALAGRFINPQESLFTRDGAYAGPRLERVLESELSSDEQDGANRVEATFRDVDGSICRAFVSARVSGVACRDDEGWRVRLAGASSPTDVERRDAAIAGETLSPAQEREARSRGWR